MLLCFGYSEILRVIDSLQLTDRLKVIATPANWTVSVYRQYEAFWNKKYFCLPVHLKLTACLFSARHEGDDPTSCEGRGSTQVVPQGRGQGHHAIRHLICANHNWLLSLLLGFRFVILYHVVKNNTYIRC